MRQDDRRTSSGRYPAQPAFPVIDGDRFLQTIARSPKSEIHVAHSIELGHNVAVKVLRTGPFAAVEAGNLSLAIHPRTSHTPEPGKKGSVALGLQVDEPMERVVSRLSERGVRMMSEAAVPDAGKRVEFEDEDGNPIYLWEVRAAASRAAART